MRLISVAFPEINGRQAGTYARMARGLVRSAAENSPRTPLEMVSADGDYERMGSVGGPGPHDPKRPGLIVNTRKMELWDDAVQAAKSGEVLGLLDCDLLVVGDLSEIALTRFDFAYTARPSGATFPFNSGVTFLRVSARTRRFFARWRAENIRLLGDRGAHEPLRRKYGGINQAALGYMLENPVRGVKVVALPCEIWNCEDSTWDRFSGLTKVLHIKSGLRQACFGQKMLTPTLRPLVEIWRKYDGR